MIIRPALAWAASSLLLLAACGGTDNLSPFIAGQGEEDGAAPDPDEVITGVPEILANNLSAISFNAAANSWDVTLTSLDSGTEAGTYTAAPSINVGPYLAYTVQDDSLDRFFTLLIQESADASIRAGAVADGGQFNRFFGGSFYERTGAYDPATGLAEYTGSYAGVTNIDGDGALLLTPPAGTDPNDLPGQSDRVSGDVFVNVDFVDNAINGAIRNRVLIENGNALEDLVLIVTDIDANGAFLGEVENEEFDGLGNYGGIIGGTAGQYIGGAVYVQDYTDDFLNEEEYGVFVLENCDTSGDPSCP
ncbi:MAG: hypothetical protein AAFP13_07205 [Pseudomonadota bacterium]